MESYSIFVRNFLPCQMIPRTLSTVVFEAAQKLPVITLTGP